MKFFIRTTFLFIAAVFASIGQAEVLVVPVDAFSAAFGGQAIDYSVRVAANKRQNKTIYWSHSAQERTIQRGEASSGRDGLVSIRLQLPKIRNGLVQKTQLEFRTSESEQRLPLWLLPEDPFEGHVLEFERLQLQLLDTTSATATVFDRFKIPHNRIRSLAAVDDGALIVGEGNSISGSVMARLLEAARSGRTVVVFASENLAIPISLSQSTDVRAAVERDLRLSTGRGVLVQRRHVDAGFWKNRSLNNADTYRGSLTSRRGAVEFKTSEDSGEWPWLELQYPQTGGRFIYCGFRLVENIDDGPVPRLFLCRLLQSLSLQSDSTGE